MLKPRSAENGQGVGTNRFMSAQGILEWSDREV
jgi:hypothetical protein